MAELTATQTQILLITTFLSITWGIYVLGTVKDYIDARRSEPRRFGDVVATLRRFIVALCLWLFVFSFCFRIVSVYLGLSEDVVGQIIFFSLLGSNVVGSIFAVISLRYD